MNASSFGPLQESHKKNIMQLSRIQSKIYEIRDQKVILDFDIAALYNVDTKVLKQAVKRNE